MLQGRRVVILVEDGFEDSELLEPMRALKEAGAKVFVIGKLAGETYRGKHLVSTVYTDDAADRVNASDFDAVIIPGGLAPQKMREYEEMNRLVRDADNAGRIIAAICHGPQLLASAGILSGRRITSWPEIRDELCRAGARWIDKPVVRDGNIITSQKVADIPKFNKAIVEALR